jgi:hypothetical protein
MLRRRQQQDPSSAPGSPASAARRTSPPFGFDSGMQFHPGNSAWGLSYNAARGEMFLATPFSTGAGFSVANLPVNKWIQLEDRNGRPAPVEVCADDISVQGRWLL